MLAQQNYLTKMDLDGFIFLHENPIFMSVQVVVIPLDIITTWTNPDGHKDMTFTEKYEAVQVRFGEVILLCCFMDHGYIIPYSIVMAENHL